MDTVGTVLILIGIYLLNSAVKNRRPVKLAQQIIANPRQAKSAAESAEGYVAVETGAPRYTSTQVPASGDTGGTETVPSGGDIPDPSLALLASKTSGSSAENGLKPVARTGLRVIAATFPQIKSMGGRGSRPVATSDHPKGLAVDFMIPRWNTAAGNAFGWRVAHFVQANAGKLGVKYIIFDAKKWNPAVSNAWRPYVHQNGNSNPTLAHRDHVHVSFKG